MKLISDITSHFAVPANIEAQFEQSGGVKVFFVTPTVTNENLYRIMLPFSYLENFMKVNTAMLGVTPYNGLPYEDASDIVIRKHHIKWADVIVFPFTIQPLKEVYEEVRKDNPDIKIIYNLDFDPFHLPETHILKPIMNEQKMSEIEDNILFSDLTLVGNAAMQAYLSEKHFAETTKEISNPPEVIAFPYLAYYPALYDQQLTPEVNAKIRLAVPLTNYSELTIFSKHLADAALRFKEYLDVFIIGGKKDDYEYIKATEGLPHTNIPYVGTYHDAVLNLHPDIMLYLSGASLFNVNSDNPRRLVDFGMLGVPCIVPSYSPMADMVRRSGWVLEKNKFLVQMLEQVINHPPTLDEHSKETFKITTSEHTYGVEEEMQRLINIFAKKKVPVVQKQV